MNMMDSRKFRRKRKPLTPGEPSVQEDTSKDMAPVPPLETREERLARRAREEGAQHPADPEANRLARAREAARLAAAEARRRAEEKAEADARREAEEQASDEAEAEGGCGVTGFACTIAVRGKHIYEPSIQMNYKF